jgi:hypothetical protein
MENLFCKEFKNNNSFIINFEENNNFCESPEDFEIITDLIEIIEEPKKEIKEILTILTINNYIETNKPKEKVYCSTPKAKTISLNGKVITNSNNSSKSTAIEDNTNNYSSICRVSSPFHKKFSNI